MRAFQRSLRFRFLKIRGLSPAVVLMLAILAAPEAPGRAIKSNVTWQPAKLVNGSPVLFHVSLANAKTVWGEWMGHKFEFFREGATSWYALAGVPVDAKAGTYGLTIRADLSPGVRQIMKSVKVSVAKYPKITAHVATKFTEPNPEQLKEINADKAVKQPVLATETSQRLWRGKFLAPVGSPVSDIFGTERVFNGEVQSRHLGLDFAAPAGTEVRAINAGTVILAQPLYFEGGFVVIDHGQGLLSLYLHLSEFRVKQGEQVTSGQIVGLSGSSGRATGPHLHLAVRWQGVYVDPAMLLRMQIQ